MKYANYKYHGQNINNLGDHAQIMTIDYLYSLMGIPADEIIYVDIHDLSTYDGPQVYLPVSLPLINYSENGIAGMFSKKITPIFFGLTMPKQTLLPAEVTYYKKYEPIGCRDEQAYLTLKKYGIKAYLGGCLTVSLPKRKANVEKQNKVFIVDIPKGLKEYIPDEIMNQAVRGTHIYYDYVKDPTKLARERYQQYQEEAKLVITGLLHASVPCMAYGIPVILARDYLSYRFAWLESLLPIYTKEDYEHIDWNPTPVELENHKKLVQTLFIKRMSGQNAAREIEQIHGFYMNRKRGKYVVDVFLTLQQFIDDVWKDHNAPYEYAVWGLTQMAEITVDYVTQNYPNAKLTHVYDKQEGLTLNGFPAISPENIKRYPNETVFVTTVSAAETAEKFFKQIGKPSHLYKTLEIIR